MPGVIEYQFPIDPAERSYCVFPDDVECDPLTAFHGTSEQNLRFILEEGFRFVGPLGSHSFARSSALALAYACERRSEGSPNGGIVAVRFGSLEGVVEEAFGYHVHLQAAAERSLTLWRECADAGESPQLMLWTLKLCHNLCA